jgi:hypothetical protein
LSLRSAAVGGRRSGVAALCAIPLGSCCRPGCRRWLPRSGCSILTWRFWPVGCGPG